MDYDLGIKQKYIEQKEAKLIVPKRDLETSEEEFIESTPIGCIEGCGWHFANSSLFIFPQGSYIRNLCQMCVEIEDDGEGDKDKNKNSAMNIRPEEESPEKGNAPLASPRGQAG
jgi:hypothetical protein